jgi:hypothetical protein
MLRRMALVRTDVSKERMTSINRVTRIGELGTTSAVTRNRRTLQLLVTANVVPGSPILVTLLMEALRSSETSVLTRTTLRNIQEDGILQLMFALNLVTWIRNNKLANNETANEWGGMELYL